MAKKRKSFRETTVTEFMTGRYGYDELSKMLIILSMLLLILTAFLGTKWLYLVAIIVMAMGYGRMASKKIARRQKENELYLNLVIYKLFPKKKAAAEEKKGKAVKYSTFEKSEELGEDDVVYKCYKCRGCEHELKFPSGQGIVKIVCPKCGNTLVDRL